MIREVIDMIPFKNFAEETVNCWLSYTMSMPVSFDLPVIFLFLIQYFGFRQIRDFFAYQRSGTQLELPQDPEQSLDL